MPHDCTATAPETIQAPRVATTAEDLSAPRLPVSGTNKTLDVRIQAAQRVLDGYEAACRAHNAAEEAARVAKDDPDALKAERAADRAFQAHLLRAENSTLSILKVRANTLAEAELKLNAFLMGTALRCSTFKHWKVYSTEEALAALNMWHGGGDEAFGPALETYAADVARLSTPKPPSPAEARAQAKWDAALQAYLAARDAHDAIGQQSRAHYIKTFAEAPEDLLKPSLHYQMHWRWLSCESVDNDVTLSSDAKAVIKPRLVEAQRRQEEIWSKPEIKAAEDAFGKASDENYELMSDAYDVLMKSPAPTAEAMVIRSALMAVECSDDRLGFDDLGGIVFKLQHYLDDRRAVQTHMDLLRLAGIDHPMLHLPAFSPGRWIAKYERLGGKVSEDLDRLLLVHPDAPSPKAEALRDSLLASNWQTRAVFLVAESRKDQGGDPIYGAHGDVGNKDRRHASQRFYGYVKKATAVRFVPNPAGGTPLLHIEQVDNTRAKV